MIRRLRTLCLLGALLAVLGGAGCAGPETADRSSSAGGMTGMPDGTSGPVEIVETLGEDDMEVLAVGPELTMAEERGLMIFRHFCAHCHGLTGEGDGQNSYGLETPPRDLLTLELDGSRTDDELRLVITEGGAARGFSPLMPPWGHTVEPERIADLVALIHILPDIELEDEGEDASPSLDNEAGTDDFSL